jgi:hypothetical protein
VQIFYIFPFRSVQVRSGPFRSVQVRSGPFRSVQVRSGPFRSVQVPFRSFQVRSGPFRSFHVLSKVPALPPTNKPVGVGRPEDVKHGNLA